MNLLQLRLKGLVGIIQTLVDDHELSDLVFVISRLIITFDQVLVELFAKFLVLLRKRHFLLNEKLDVVLEALRLSQLLQKFGDLLLLKLDRLVTGVNLDLNLLDLGKQFDELLILGLELTVQLDDLIFKALDFVRGGRRQVTGHLSVVIFEQRRLSNTLVHVSILLKLHANSNIVAF